jgi:OHS family lactose permease-like MFS transporter
MLLSPLVGYGYDHFGFSSVYVLMAGLVGACLLLSWTLLRKDPVRDASQVGAGDSRQLPAIAPSAPRYEP